MAASPANCPAAWHVHAPPLASTQGSSNARLMPCGSLTQGALCGAADQACCCAAKPASHCRVPVMCCQQAAQLPTLQQPGGVPPAACTQGPTRARHVLSAGCRTASPQSAMLSP